jgi:type IV secretory pathway VirB2 component (pilin)
VDEFRALGGGSPFCSRQLSGAAARNCRSSGALAHPYPIGNYGLDVHINTGVTRIESNLMLALQTLAALCWLGLLYLMQGVLLLLEWAFSLDLLGSALADVRRALLGLHQSVLGQPWFSLAIAVAGLWGIWRGFVQRRTIETVAGLAATVALMLVALVLIQSPDQTVGEASRMANEASLGLLAGASTSSVAGGERAFGNAATRVFDSLVLRPWCALEFGDVRFCLARPPGDVPEQLKSDAQQSRSVADLWLRFPAGGAERNQLYERWRGDDNPLQPKVRLQKEGQTATRIALVLLIAIGLLGASCLLGWLGFKLLLQAVMALLLLLAAPAMLLAPAFGDSGRGIFVGWAKRLLAALVAKAVFALLLALASVSSDFG